MDYDSRLVTESKAIERVKAPYGKGARDLWKNKYCQKNVTGSGNYLFALLKPNSEEEFYHKFVEYAAEHPRKSIAWRGVSEDELKSLAREFKSDFEENAQCDYPEQTYYNYLLLHLIQEPFNGHKKEIEFLQYLRSKGRNAKLADGELDLKYKVDILVDDKIGIQIKRETILYSKSENVQKAIDDIGKAMREVKAKFGIDMYYGIYRLDGSWMYTDNGKILFTYEEFKKLREARWKIS